MKTEYEPLIYQHGIRLISDCSCAVNKFTMFRSHQADDIKMAICSLQTSLKLFILFD